MLREQALRIAEVSQNMVVSSLAVMRDDNDLLRNEIIKNEDTVDNLFDSIKLYIAQNITRRAFTSRKPTSTQYS